MNLYILPTVEQDTFCRSPIATCTACLLIVGLHVAWHLVMQHIAHITLVDAHTKGISSHHDLQFIICISVLHLTAHLIAETSMIMAYLNACTG